MTRILVAGVSTRAAAESAARAGFDVTALDGYADRDQHAGVRALSLPRDPGNPFTAATAARVAATIAADAVVYLSNFENDPDAIARLASQRTLWGNSPEVVRRARNPFFVARMFRAHGLVTPCVWTDDSAGTASPIPAHRSDVTDANGRTGPNDRNGPIDPNGWLRKPLASGGGHGIRAWQADCHVGRGYYLQQRIDGIPGSIVFVAAGGQAVPLAVSRQLIGDPRFGASGYRYCGSILAPPSDPQFERGEALTRAAHALADVAAAELSLVGVNGVDFVARSGVPYPVEINPRWSASMELVERAGGVSVFAAHAAACTSGDLSAVNDLRPHVPAVGKAVVFARHHVVIGNTDDWLNDPDVRDVPHAGETIAAGSPVCTVLAEAPDGASCEAALVARARSIDRTLARWRTSSVPPLTIHDSRFTIDT